VAAVLAATAGVGVAMDVIDSRYRDFKFSLTDVIADNASSARFALGSRLVPPSALELDLVGVVLRADGAVVATAAGAAVLGHPAVGMAWAVNHMAGMGESLPAGSIVLAGALTDAVPIGPGKVVEAEADGLGTVRLRAGEAA